MFWIYILLITHGYSTWNYNNNGNDWHLTYPDCNGGTQSPVDFDSSMQFTCPVTNGQTDHHLEWIWKTHQTFNIKNNGHTLKLTPITKTGISTFESNNKNTNEIARLLNRFGSTSTDHKEYCLDSIHFHFGSSNTQGSEHTVYGTHYPLEAHLVHFSCDYLTLSDALDAYNSGGLTDQFVLGVVAIFFNVDNDHPNGFIDRMIRNYPKLWYFENEINLSLLNVGDLIPNDIYSYYYYEGSLTTPSCSPVVRWHVLKEHQGVSDYQLTLLRTLQTESGSMENNFRPVQINSNPKYYCD